MQDSHDISKVMRFETFELNLKTGELRKGGVKIRLQEQSFQILAALFERPGKLVTREALHQRLWPGDTFVDFETGLNIAVSKLRQALGDSADEPRLIETLPRRGYRFAGAVEQLGGSGKIRGLPIEPIGTKDEQTISHYRLLEKLGEGGMGVVYKAEDTKLKRLVALKFLRSGVLEDEEHRERFLREAQAAASLNHPNISTIYEIDEVEGLPFIAMELVEGESIKQKIKMRPLELDQAIEIVVQTLQGLQAAHEKGIVHRDIKGSNLMLTPKGQVKIMDFGLAQLAERSQLTKTATILGTPAYMSPEQARRQPIDRRTDIWSVGVVVYEMLTGRLPFEGERQEAVLYAIGNEEPDPITALRSGLPVELDRIVSKAMAKNPDERYQHVDEMLVDLRSMRKAAETGGDIGDIGRGTPRRTPVRPKPASVPAAHPKHRLGIIAAVAGIAVVCAAVWWGTRTDVPSEPGTASATAELASIVVLPFENLSGDPEQDFFSDGASSEVIGNLSGVQSLRVISWTTARRYKNTGKSAPEIAAELDVSHLLEGSVLRAGEDVRITVRLTDARQDRQIWSDSFEGLLAAILRLQQEVAQAVAPEIEGRLTFAERGLEAESDVPPEAYVSYLKGLAEYRKDAGADGLDRALAYYQQAVEAAPDFAAAHAETALMYQAHSFDKVMSVAEAQSRARTAMRKALSLDPNQPTALRVQGDSRMFDWDWAGAKETFETALEAFPSDSGIRISYANLLSIHGRFEDARKEILRACRLDPQAVTSLRSVAYVHYLTRDYDTAEVYARRQRKEHPGSAAGLEDLVLVALAREQYDAAVSFARQMPDTQLNKQTSFVYAYSQKGDRESAARALDEIRRRASTVHVSPWRWAIAYTGLGDKENALTSLERAFQERDVWLILLGIYPVFDPLRSEPRFRDLVEKMNFPFSM